MSKRKIDKAVVKSAGKVVKLRIRPDDVEVLNWANQADFNALRQNWLEQHRRDDHLAAPTIVILAELAGRMSHKNSGSWPGVPRLSADLAMSQSVVKRGVAEAKDRGWLTVERRFGRTNVYLMSASRRVLEQVSRTHAERIRVFEANAAQAGADTEVEDDLTIGSDPTSLSGQIRPHDQVRDDLVTLPSNPAKERHSKNASKKGLTSAAGLAAVHRLLGHGDVSKGEQVAALLGLSQTSRLAEHVHAVGEIAAAEAITSAIQRAAPTVPAPSSAPSVIVLADARAAAPSVPKPKAKAKRAADQGQGDLFAATCNTTSSPTENDYD